MKLQPDKSDVQTIHGYGPGWVAVNGEKYSHSLIVGSSGQLLPWTASSFTDLNADHFEQLTALGVELLIFGSGTRIRFPQAAWLRPLIERRIGIETMDTAAACRTYNILAQEGRKVAAALLIEAAP